MIFPSGSVRVARLAFFRGSWREKNCLAFLEAVGTYYQTGVLAF